MRYLTVPETSEETGDVSRRHRPAPAGHLGDESTAPSSFYDATGLPILILLLFSFIGRWLLASWTSYWYDELLSVAVYGSWHETLAEALRAFRGSIHPPLYQVILYGWIEVFGTSEIATRALSNLYVTLATLFVYLIGKRGYSARIGLLAAGLFAVMNTPVFYALEARSYAQTMFLVTVSAYFLLYAVELVQVSAPRRRKLTWPLVGLTISNTALLLTHYYNGFVWMAHGVVAILLLIFVSRSRIKDLVALVASYILQAAIFLVIWGEQLLEDLVGPAESFALDPETISWTTRFLDLVIRPNIQVDRTVGWIVALVCTLAVLRIMTTSPATKKRMHSSTPIKEWATAFTGLWLILPLVIAFATFSLTGTGSFRVRYFVFTAPALALLLAAVAGELCAAIRNRLSAQSRPVETIVNVLVAAAVFLLLLPGTLQAATTAKEDFRGIALDVAQIVGHSPESSFILFEAGHRRRPMIQFYFDRLGSQIEVYDSLQPSEELRGEHRILSDHRDVIEAHDYLVLMFPHLRTVHFPGALALLEDRYDVLLRNLNSQGRGYIILATRDGYSGDS